MEGFEIPIGADFTALENAMNTMAAKMATMGASMSAALERSNATISQAVTAIGKLQTGTAAAGASAGTLGQTFMKATTTAGNLGHAAAGVVGGLQALNTASRALHGINLAARVGGWVQSFGGLRAALGSIPGAMRAIAGNRTFQLMAAGAVLAVGSIYTIRTAFRTVAGSIRGLGSAANSVFNGMVSAAKGSARAISGAFKGVSSALGSMMPGGLPIAGIVSAAGAIGIAFKSIGKAAEMETAEAAFAPLLGSAKAAKDRLAELAKFAKDTPFELPEVAAASRVLQTLTKGALATSTGLTLVGDVAAGTNAPFDELSVTIGRLYDGLQSGRPVGEAMARLQELGAISGNVRSKIEALQKEGAKGGEVWGVAAAALHAFDGSMARLAQTWKGKLSNLSGSIDLVMAALGTPIIDGLKPFLDMAIIKIESLESAGVSMGNAIRTALDGAMAAWQTNSIGALLMNGLELAFITGINTFMDGLKDGAVFLSAALVGIFGSIKDGLMKSGLLGVFNNLATVIASTISAGILSAMGKVTGWKGWELDAEKERGQADFSMGLLKSGLGQLDFLGGMKAMLDGLERTWTDTKTARAKNKGAPFIDDQDASQSYFETMKTIEAQAEKNRAAINEANAKRDASLSKPNWTIESPMAAVSKAVAPAVMSLTRVGGGGFANSVMNSQLSEARRQTAYLKTIAGKTAPTIPIAVYA